MTKKLILKERCTLRDFRNKKRINKKIKKSFYLQKICVTHIMKYEIQNTFSSFAHNDSRNIT